MLQMWELIDIDGQDGDYSYIWWDLLCPDWLPVSLVTHPHVAGKKEDSKAAKQRVPQWVPQ